MNEVYKPIPDHEPYEASNLGNVRDGNKILNQHLTKKGYKTIYITVNGKKKNVFVHRLVVYAFYGISSLSVDHVDEDKGNNNLKNLEYVTSRENSKRWNANNIKRATGAYPRGKKWVSYIWFKGKNRNLGTYDTEQEAHERYLSAYDEIEAFGQLTRKNIRSWRRRCE